MHSKNSPSNQSKSTKFCDPNRFQYSINAKKAQRATSGFEQTLAEFGLEKFFRIPALRFIHFGDVVTGFERPAFWASSAPAVGESKNMMDAMETYIAGQNIARYKALLREETHPDKRKILLQLLANEVAKHPEAVQPVEDRCPEEGVFR